MTRSVEERLADFEAWARSRPEPPEDDQPAQQMWVHSCLLDDLPSYGLMAPGCRWVTCKESS